MNTYLKIHSESLDPQLEKVVLVHGLFATRRSMKKLEQRLAAEGFSVLNWSYPTWLRSTEQHVRRLVASLATLQANPCVSAIHFVTHSMGGILARSALHLGSHAKVRRLVMLAPPNRGSHLTRISLGPFAWCVPAIADLSESPDSLANRIPLTKEVEIGVIAASRDIIVPIANTLLPNQRDHCVLKTSHFKLPYHDTAVSNVVAFLRHGHFERHVQRLDEIAEARKAA